MCLNMKVTLSLALPGTVHHRDISTKGAAVCLISPAQMGERWRLGQPKVRGPSLTSIVLMETVVSSRWRWDRLKIVMGKWFQPCTSLMSSLHQITPYHVNKHVTISSCRRYDNSNAVGWMSVGSPTKSAMRVIKKGNGCRCIVCGVPCGGVVVSACITFNSSVISSTTSISAARLQCILLNIHREKSKQ